MNKTELLSTIKNGLIVSCQALENEPLHGSVIMGKMALAAKMGGAIAIRANSVEDIKEIKKTVDLPVIGLIKRDYNNKERYITPTLKEIKELIEVGVDVIALDATQRDGMTEKEYKEIVDFIHENNTFAMADISTFEEGVLADKVGFDLVSTTLSGYTDYSPKQDCPDYKLVKKLVKTIKTPVIAEGKIYNPNHLKKMIKQKPYAIVMGSAITRPKIITEKYMGVVKKYWK